MCSIYRRLPKCRGTYPIGRYREGRGALPPAASLSVAPPAPLLIKRHRGQHGNGPELCSPSSASNMTSSFQPIAAEPVPEKDGLIHGVSAQELQVLGAECIEAKTKAYCTYARFMAATWAGQGRI
jgi:hypothetical protein